MESTRLVVQRVCMCVCVCEESVRVYMKTYWRALCDKIVLVFILLVSLVYGEEERLCCPCLCLFWSCKPTHGHMQYNEQFDTSWDLFSPSAWARLSTTRRQEGQCNKLSPVDIPQKSGHFWVFYSYIISISCILGKKISGTQPSCHMRLRRQISKFKTPPHFMTGTTLSNSFPCLDRDHIKQNFWLVLFS